MTIKLYNTKTRSKEVFQPLVDGQASMYVCGPTVYERAHLGNARPVLVFDMLFRLLRHEYGADNVRYVRNFTDVDDKINARATETGREISQITDETIQWFLDDMGALGALEPTDAPRATAYIDQMIAMIEDLIARGHAYAAEGHVLFKVRSYAEYGKLSGRSVDDMIAGARVEVAPYKEDPMDFVMWKPSSDDLPGWASPWGRGRPGWHIECSAMAFELLGAAFDIHGGGNDLTFPHHENEIAQSKCAGHDFANVWMHNEMLQVEGKKMSKSLGNFFTVRDLLDQGVPGEVIRFVMLSTHYRKPMDWTEEKRIRAMGTLSRWRNSVKGVKIGKVDSKTIEIIADDLNVSGAIHRLMELDANENWDSLLATGQFLGLLTEEGGAWYEQQQASRERSSAEKIIELRKKARSKKDYQLADKIRDELHKFGIELKDVPGGKTKANLNVDYAIRWEQSLTASERENLIVDKSDLIEICNKYEEYVLKELTEALK